MIFRSEVSLGASRPILNRVLDVQGNQLFKLFRFFELPEIQTLQDLLIVMLSHRDDRFMTLCIEGLQSVVPGLDVQEAEGSRTVPSLSLISRSSMRFVFLSGTSTGFSSDHKLSSSPASRSLQLRSQLLRMICPSR